MELVLVKIDSSEWDFMWAWLDKHPLNEGLTEPSIALHEGEMWAYMGSYKQKERIVHTFRHRKHPTTQKLEEISVQASAHMNLSQIQKKYKI